jgi:parallel beta-helix repeat protein
VTGLLTVSLAANYTNVAMGYAANLAALITGRVSDSVWEFGDGDVAINEPFITHRWTQPGDYVVELWAFNESNPGGVSATLTIHVVAAPPVVYVAASSTNSQPPYSTWATAATNLQAAVGLAVPGAMVLVTNGTYPGGLTVTTPLALMSVNGSQFTVINGYGTNQCVSLAGGVSLSGFTVANGSGGVLCADNAFVTNCLITGNQAGGAFGGTFYNCTLSSNSAPAYYGGGATLSTLYDCTLSGNSTPGNGYGAGGGGASGCTLSNCTLSGNSASSGYGGGASGCTLYNCTLSGNSADVGGGADGSTLSNCTLSSNSAPGGAGAYNSILYNCTLTGNLALPRYPPFYDGGGGAYKSTLYNCTLSGNSGYQGGGAYKSTLYNCALSGNSASSGYGGGGYDSTFYNCTLTGNSAPEYLGHPGYGGACYCTLHNCIAYFNTGTGGWANYDPNTTLNYCCTAPLPTNGMGNIYVDPQLASASHLSTASPCRGAGSAAYASGTDIDGEAWNNPPSIGCDEYHPGAVTGPLTVSLTADYTNVAVGYAVNLTALIDGRTSDDVWDFGDGTLAINEPYIRHRWMQPGDFVVVLGAFNESSPGGVATLTIHVVAQSVVYVAASSTNSQPPYANWATAATNLQAAVGVALPGAVVLATNGVYPGGVIVTTPVALRSVNGPQFTLINGYETNQCVILAGGGSLTGFTLTNGSRGVSSAEAFVTNCVITGIESSGASGGTLYNCTLLGQFGYDGGGASSCRLYNCTLSGHSGGTAYLCTLYNCTLSGNSTTRYGGGADSCTLYNCTLSGNTAAYGGGAYSCTLYYCALSGNSAYENVAGGSGGGAYSCTLHNCTLSGNSAPSGFGGGAEWCTLYNCALSSNSAGAGGGGAEYSTLYNCTLSGNSADVGGGAYNSALANCIAYFNTASSGEANYDTSSTLNFCCTTPLPTNGTGNISVPPLFVSTNGNLRLQSNSPCINAGNNAYVTTSTDLDGNPRIVSGPVDIGAYEYQGAGSVISYAWLQQYGLATDGSVDHADLDGTGFTVYQDWVAGLNPTNALSVLALLPPTATNNPPGLVISWESVPNISYFVQRSTDLAAQPAFTTLQSNIVGQAGTTSYTDTSATGPGPFFYRVGATAP